MIHCCPQLRYRSLRALVWRVLIGIKSTSLELRRRDIDAIDLYQGGCRLRGAISEQRSPASNCRRAAMFKHILIPTDGSDLSKNAVAQGISLAKHLGAKITVLHVVPEFHAGPYRTENVCETHSQFLASTGLRAEEVLDKVRASAGLACVECEALFAIDDQPYAAVINTAAKKGCDLILMASHGVNGRQGRLGVSETQKVLAHCMVPVLVYR
jgi:nucleotide-binding universal stress UspA family protein